MSLWPPRASRSTSDPFLPIRQNNIKNGRCHRTAAIFYTLRHPARRWPGLVGDVQFHCKVPYPGLRSTKGFSSEVDRIQKKEYSKRSNRTNVLLLRFVFPEIGAHRPQLAAGTLSRAAVSSTLRSEKRQPKPPEGRPPNHNPTKWLWFGKEPQQNELAVTFKKSRRKRYGACKKIPPESEPSAAGPIRKGGAAE